jgi:hypothetical protein
VSSNGQVYGVRGGQFEAEWWEIPWLRSGFRRVAQTPRKRLKFDSPRCCQVMNTQTIEIEGFEIEIASELYCERGGDHHELADRARTDRSRLGHNVDESAVLCVRCMKAIPLKG